MSGELMAIVVIGGTVLFGLIVGLILVSRQLSSKVEPPADGGAQSPGIGELMSMVASRDGTITEKVAQLDVKLASLQDSISSREVALNTQVADMGAQVRTIAGLFTNDRARGSWGEISMVRILESGGLVEGLDYDTQVNYNGRTPDAVIHLPGGCEVVIDSKFPIARYIEALDEDDPAERTRLLRLHGAELESVARDLTKKNYTDFATGSYVIMYLPSQAVYEAAVAATPEVMERMMTSRVILAGPSALFAILMNVGSVIKEHRAIQQADEILGQAKELQTRMTTFVGHLEKVGRSLNSTVTAYNGAVGSWASNVAPHLKRIGELRGESMTSDLTPIDDVVRPVVIPQRRLEVAGYG